MRFGLNTFLVSSGFTDADFPLIQTFTSYGAGVVELAIVEPAAVTVPLLIDALADEIQDIQLIVLDTKSANMTGSDSDPGLMNTWINNLRYLQRKFGCTVLVIDHVGHMETDRPRGVSQQMGVREAVL